MLKRLALITIAFSFALFADAKTWRTESYQFESASIAVVEIDHPVGDLEIIGGSSDRIEIRMRIQCSSWRNSCEDRTENIQLDARTSGSTLDLRLRGFPKTVNKLSVDLEIMMPKRLSLVVDRGVGETRVRGMEGDISLDTGVGEVRIKGPARSIGKVRAQSGVGDARLDVPGGRVEKEGFLFLGNELKWRGEGTSTIDVDMGVGSIRISLE